MVDRPPRGRDRGHRRQPGRRASGAGSPGFAASPRSASGTRCASPRSRSSSRSRSARSCCSRAARRRRPPLPLRRAAARSSRCSPRRRAPAPPSASSTGLDFESLPSERQRLIALAIVRRETGIMAVSALVDLLPRAARGGDERAGCQPSPTPARSGRQSPGSVARRRKSSGSPSPASELEHSPGGDHVVAAVVHVAQLAGEPDSARRRSSGRPARSATATPSHFSGCGSLVRTRARASAWSAASTLIAEPARVLDRAQRARAEVEAGEHQRRLERQRGDRVGRRARRARPARWR